MQRPTLDSLASVAVVVAAIAVVSTSLGSGRTARRDTDAPSSFISEWRSILPYGVRTGDTSLPVKLIEFADFECAFCARHHPAVEQVMVDFAELVEFVHVHLPLPQHRFAVPAARASECAHDQGRFPQMQTALYTFQDSLGFLDWSEYARLAGVPDSARFAACITSPQSLVRVDSGRSVGSRFRIAGTPTFIVNGHVVSGGGPDSLRALIRTAMRGLDR